MSLLEEQYKNNDIQYELGRNFIEYAVAVNSDRSIPDAKSGLKPVAKRILWSAYEEGRTFSKPHVKSARIVGDVMGKYHPHGDSSIYGAMVRLSQPWVMRYPLIDWHGSNGNQSGDGPAASRYTEARLAKISEDGLLAGLKKKNVDFIPNYDETMDEPVTIPAIFPNLLCNPNTGIGVAIACNWPPHNLNEVAQAIYDYLDGKEPMLPGPDFATGGVVINKDDIPNIMRTGSGTIKLRGKYKIEKNQIIFYELPYQVSTENLIDELKEICDSKEIDGISDIHDESNKHGLRIVITCNKNVSPDFIVSLLFAKTSLQVSFSYNMTALVGKTPTKLNLTQCIEIYVNHNEECILREAQFDLTEAKDRLEVTEGLIKALEDIDNIIQLIKSSENKQQAKENLIKKYNFTDRQAEAILSMKLSSLTKLDKIELNDKRNELIDKIANLDEICNSKSKRLQILKEKLQDLVIKYDDGRRTELVQIEEPKTTAEKKAKEIPSEDITITLTHTGVIQRNVKIGRTLKKLADIPINTIKLNTKDYILFFSNMGKMYRLLANEVTEGSKLDIASLLTLAPNEKIISFTSSTAPHQYAIFATNNGNVKKTAFEEYSSIKKSYVDAIKLKENDFVVSVNFINNEQIVLVSTNGFILRVDSTTISTTGRVTMGAKVIKLVDPDSLNSCFPIVDKQTVGIIYQDGNGKRISIDEIPLLSKGNTGVALGHKVKKAVAISPKDKIFIASGKGVSLDSSDLPLLSRVSGGELLVRDTNIKEIVKY